MCTLATDKILAILARIRERKAGLKKSINFVVIYSFFYVYFLLWQLSFGYLQPNIIWSPQSKSLVTTTTIVVTAQHLFSFSTFIWL